VKEVWHSTFKKRDTLTETQSEIHRPKKKKTQGSSKKEGGSLLSVEYWAKTANSTLFTSRESQRNFLDLDDARAFSQPIRQFATTTATTTTSLQNYINTVEVHEKKKIVQETR